MSKYLYVSSRKELKDYLEDNFNNIYYIKSIPSKLSLLKLLSYIKKNSFSEVIIENYFPSIDNFINKLNEKNITVKVVYTDGLATLNDKVNLANFVKLLDLLKDNKIKLLGFTEDNIYEVYKDTSGVRKVKLTVKNSNKVKTEKNLVGIIGDPFNWQSNYFNQLSAIKMIKGKKANLLNGKKIAKRYCDFFNIENNNYKEKFNVTNFRKYLLDSEVMSCVEFSNYADLFVIDSYNAGVPVVLGNNTLFFNDKLVNKVCIKSDDDIEEISKKIEYLISNRKDIIKEYQVLKDKYDIESRKLINKFIEE